MSLIPTGGAPADTARLRHWLSQAVDGLGQVMATLDGSVVAAGNDHDAGDLAVLLSGVEDAYHAADTPLRRLNAFDGLRPEIRKAAAARARLSQSSRGGGTGA